jgi:hypothetical protein
VAPDKGGDVVYVPVYETPGVRPQQHPMRGVSERGGQAGGGGWRFGS